MLNGTCTSTGIRRNVDPRPPRALPRHRILPCVVSRVTNTKINISTSRSPFALCLPRSPASAVRLLGRRAAGLALGTHPVYKF
jgi:hypothetical protein